MAKDHVGEVVSIPCVRCGITRHTIRGTYESHWVDEENDLSAGSTYDLLECNGCQHATLRDTYWFSEEPESNSVTYWPPRRSETPLRKPKDFDQLDYGAPVDSVYRQTITAFNNGLATLAGAGIRLLIEGICRDQRTLKGKVYTEQGKLIRDGANKPSLRDTLEGKINGLLMKGLVSKNQAKVLHELRKLGNDAAHALDQPSLKLIEECIETIEHLFFQIYRQPELLGKLRRRPKPKK